VTKIEILHPLLFLKPLTIHHIHIYTKLRRKKYHNIYVQKAGNSRLVKFFILLMSVTKSRDRIILTCTRLLALHLLRIKQ